MTTARFISPTAHGLIDYGIGVWLIVMPRLFGFAGAGIAAARVPDFLGLAVIGYSLFTRYEYGLIRLLPFRFHLWLDMVHGLVLGASPWFFGFADRMWAPHLVFGLLGLAVVMLTRPGDDEAPVRPEGTWHTPA